jgi:ankyrin repeat protein
MRTVVNEVEYIVNADASALEIVDDSGNTPLHLTWQCWKHGMCQVPKLILTMNEDAAFVRNLRGELPLYCVCAETDFSSIESVALFGEFLDLYKGRHSPKTDYFSMTCNEGYTLLHRICCNKRKGASKMVLRLLELCPQAAAIPNNYGSHPLHTALRNMHADDTTIPEAKKAIDLLISAYPAACSITDESRYCDQTPVHIASARCPVSVVKAVLSFIPSDEVTAMFQNRRTPFVSAILSNQNIEVIRYLFELYPDAFKRVGENKMLPLHAAAMSKNLVTVKMIYKLDPGCISKTDSLGRTPLHCFTDLISNREFATLTPTDPVADTFRFLVRKYPQAALLRNKKQISPLSYFEEMIWEAYFERFILRTLGDYKLQALHDLNYDERRGAMYLLYSVSTAAMTVGQSRGLLIWRLLRERDSRELNEAVVSFL